MSGSARCELKQQELYSVQICKIQPTRGILFDMPKAAKSDQIYTLYFLRLNAYLAAGAGAGVSG